MQVSLITTVLNEAGSIAGLLESIVAQTRQPDEVVVVDGGSTDGTWEVVAEYAERLPLRLVSAPGANISQGRNIGIGQARHEVVAVTDAGVRLDRGWLEALVNPLKADIDVDVVSGFFLADPQTAFEVAMGATVLPSLAEVDPATFLPSSRSVAFRKEAWVSVDGYPEWLDYCEDLVFDLELRRRGCRFAFAPDAVVYFRPRSTLKAFYRQYYHYARGDGKADLWRKRHLVRYATYTLGPLLAAWGWRHRKVAAGRAMLALVLLAAGVYCRRPYMRLLPQLPGLAPLGKLYTLGLIPVIRLTGDVAKMVGYPVGVLWCWRQGSGDK